MLLRIIKTLNFGLALNQLSLVIKYRENEKEIKDRSREFYTRSEDPLKPIGLDSIVVTIHIDNQKEGDTMSMILEIERRLLWTLQ
jgi:hypothetical protein